MAGKISDLTAITGANLASTDEIEVVDVSDTTMAATGTNKSTTLADLAASSAFTTKYLAPGLFGTGVDGAVTISSDTQLTSDMHYTDLTINSGVTLLAKGYKVFVTGTLTVNGTLMNGGYPNVFAPSSRVAADAGTMAGGGSAGAAGGTGVGAASGTAGDSLGGQGGTGGTGSGGAGGAGGAITNPIAVRQGLKQGNLVVALIGGYTAANGSFVGTKLVGGSGGGAGGGDGTNSGGGGGGGGGLLSVFARAIAGTGVIHCDGGGGSAASAGNCGGGGGGGGGALWVFTMTAASLPVTTRAAGGAGGAGSGTGTAGAAGAAGVVYVMSGV
jgi:hypothetical protein